jgi:cysteine desulfurase
VAELGRVCREHQVLYHTDAVQWFGKEPFTDIHQFKADLVSVCAHKFHGPKGAGALYIRSPLHPDPILFGGGHENERRAGTENLAAVVGFAEATERFVKTPVFPPDQLSKLTARLTSCIEKLGSKNAVLRTPKTQRLANTIAFTVPQADSLSLLAGLDLEGICASSGSACSAGSLEPSHVMLALGVSSDEANALVRFSLGRASTPAEVEHVERVLPGIRARVRAAV